MPNAIVVSIMTIEAAISAVHGLRTINSRTSGCALMIARARPGCGWSDSDWKNAAGIVFKLCIIVRILKRAFSVAHHRAAAERKNLPRYRDVSGEDYENEMLRRRKIGKRSQKAGPISELDVLHPRQIGIWRNHMLK